MKRYKLIKPLPMYEVGDGGFYIDSDGNLMHCASDAGETVYPASILVRHPEILKDWFEGIPERPKTEWDLKTDDIFYVIEDGRVAGGFWNNGDYTANRDTGDVFLTKEEAEKELARRKAEVILRRDTKGFKPSRSDDYRHIEVYYTDEGGLDTASDRGLDGCIYFESYEDAEASIKAHPNEWKMYLGVEE